MSDEPKMYCTPQRWLNVVFFMSWSCSIAVAVKQAVWMGFLALPICLILGSVACRIIRP